MSALRWSSLLALLIAGACGRVGFDERTGDAAIEGDSAVDAPPGVPVAHVASQSYWTNWFGTTIGTPGTDFDGYTVNTTGVVDGQLLVFVACVDNGSDTVWPTPLGAGFTQIWQRRWGNDGQTCAIDWKIAANEPASYTGMYGPGIISASSLLALVAIDNAATTDPITDSMMTTGAGAGTNPVTAVSPGVDTTAPDSLVLYISGSDWECYEVTDVAFSAPQGFTSLFVSSDRGSVTKDWTAFQIDYRYMATPGATGALQSVETSTGSAACIATPWTAAIAIAPR